MNASLKHVVLFCAVTGLYWFSLYAYVPILPGYAESLGASHWMVGIILGSYGFTQMLLRIPLGIYSDSLNRRKVFVIFGVVTACIGAVGMYLFPTPIMLLVFRALTGVAASTWVTYTVLFSSYFRESDAPKAIGYIGSFNALGQMAAMILGGFAAQTVGRSAPFVVAAAGGMLGIVLSFMIRERRVTRPRTRASELVAVGRQPRLLFVSALAILIQLITFATAYGFTPIAAERIGAGDFELGLLTTLSTAPVIFASALSGAVFAERFGERRTLIAGFMLLGLASAAIPFVRVMVLMYATQFIAGFARGVVFPLLMGVSIKSMKDRERATAMGFFQAIYGIGMSVGPVFVGVVSDALSLAWGFWLVGICGIVGALVVHLLSRGQLTEARGA